MRQEYQEQKISQEADELMCKKRARRRDGEKKCDANIRKTFAMRSQ